MAFVSRHFNHIVSSLFIYWYIAWYCFVKSWRKASRHCNSEYGQIHPWERYIFSFSIDIFVRNAICQGAVMVVIVWCLDLQLPVQSVSITIKVVSFNPLSEVYSIQYYVIKFVSDLWQVSGFLKVFQFPPPNKTDHHDITGILLKVHMASNNITSDPDLLHFHNSKVLSLVHLFSLQINIYWATITVIAW